MNNVAGGHMMIPLKLTLVEQYVSIGRLLVTRADISRM